MILIQLYLDGYTSKLLDGVWISGSSLRHLVLNTKLDVI